MFARDGYDVVLVARGEEDLQELASLVEAEYAVQTTVIARDLAKPESAESLYEEVREQDITVDALVNNAGFGALGRLTEMDPSTTFNMLQLNIVTLTQLTRFFLEGMEERSDGKILNVASTAAFQSGPLMAVYYASKAYVLWFSEALVEEVRGTGVIVTTLAPGPTDTDFQDRAGLGGTLLGPGSPLMLDVESVARRGYRGLMEGKALVVPGFLNKVHHQVIRFLPRAVVRRVVRSMQDKR